VADRKHFDSSSLLVPIAVVLVATLVSLVAIRSMIAVVIIAVVIYGVILAVAGLWRTMVGTSIVVSVLRSGAAAGGLGSTVWYALQFGPLLLAGLASLRLKPRGIRNPDRKVVLFMGLFAVDALATNITTFAPSATFPQTILLVAMTGFLLLTYARHWINMRTLRGDLGMIFAVVTAIQTVSISAVVAGAAWAFDPDYGRFRGLFSNANYAGMVSAIGIAIGLYLLRDSKRRPAIVVSMAIHAVPMVMSGSRGALLALAAAILVLIMSGSGKRVILALAALVAIVVGIGLLLSPSTFDPLKKFFFRDGASDDITSGRLGIYQWMLQLFERSPWMGTGFRSIEALNPAHLTGHDIYLTVLTEMGILGAAIFACLVIAVILASRGARPGRSLSIIAVAVATAELTESSMYGWGGPTALTEWLLVLAFAASGRFLNRSATTREAPALPGL
jgi:O-antigen ligase